MKCMVWEVGAGLVMQHELLCNVMLVLIQGTIWLYGR